MLDSLIAWLAAISRGVGLDELAESLTENFDSGRTWDIELIVGAEMMKAPGDHGHLGGRPLVLVPSRLSAPLVSPTL